MFVSVFRRLLLSLLILMSALPLQAARWSAETAYPDAAITALWQSGRTGSFAGVDNVAIHYRIFANAAQPERDAIVIVNGRTESMAKYRELIYDLRQQGFAVYAYDHRGQGYSARLQDDAQKGHVKQFGDYAADLHVLIETVVKKAGHKNLFLLTHSMGGTIAAQYLQDYPHPVNAVVMSSPMFAINSGPLNAGCRLALALDSVDGWFGDQSAYIPGGGRYEAAPFADNVYTTSENRYTIFRAAFEQEPQLQIGSPTVRWVREACAAAAGAREAVGNITAPVLVLTAGDDRIVNNRGAEQFCESLVAAGKTRCENNAPQIFAGAQHELFIERDGVRNQVLDKVMAFFRRAK